MFVVLYTFLLCIIFSLKTSNDICVLPQCKAPQTLNQCNLAQCNQTVHHFYFSNKNEKGTSYFDVIDNIDELFGDKTKPGDENKSYKNGFEALASYDSDGNGRIDIRDKDFKNLRLWFDKNGDGVTNHGELKRLSSMQVKSIVLNYEYIDEFGDANGNLSQQRSMVFLKGQPPSGVGIYDVYFANTVK